MLRPAQVLLASFLTCTAGITGVVPAQAAPGYSNAVSIHDRVYRLEQMMKNRRDIETMQQIQTLQQEIQDLRGQLEEANASVERLQRQQRELYKDIDRRLERQANNDQAQSHSRFTANTAVRSKPEVTATRTIMPAPARASVASSHMTSKALSFKPVKGPLIASEEEQQLYQEAYQLINAKRYASAEYKLREYIEQFPSGQHLPNAFYWLGEVYLLQKKPDLALQAFTQVTTQFQKHQKVGDSLLKIGYAYDAKGDRQHAKQAYLDVSQRFRGTSLARLADAQLARMKTAYQ